MDEIWKKIDGYENYSVSSDGRVRNDKTGTIYESISEASMKTGVNYSNIINGCKGIRKYAGKDEDELPMIWAYYEHYDFYEKLSEYYALFDI